MEAIIYIAIGVVVGALVVGGIWWSRGRSSRSQSKNLKKRFGPEYDRSVETLGSREAAERALVEREQRARRVRRRRLSAAEARELEARWASVEERFVDEPDEAFAEAHDLLEDLMRRLGYPADDPDEAIELISVDHPEAVQHYRAASDLAKDRRQRDLSTEELRQSFVHYRELFGELLQSSERPTRGHVRPERSRPSRPHLH